jgi:hypothetical protein
LTEERNTDILLAASTWFPLSARLATAFLRHGCTVSAICPTGHFLALVPGIGKLYRYSGIRSLHSLRKAILSSQPDLIVPCDDATTMQLHALHAEDPSLRELIERSLGNSASFPIVESRDRLLQLASELGIRVPATQATSGMLDWPHPLAVLKSDGSSGGEGVAITHDEPERRAAFDRLCKPLTLAMAIKRFIVNRNPMALWLWRTRAEPDVTIQEFIQGCAANTMIACWKGEVLASVTVEVLNSQGTTGSSTVVRLIQNAEIDEASRKLACSLGLSGFAGLDFILEPSLEGVAPKAYLIELNPRCTQLGHLVQPHQADLAGILAAKAAGRNPAEIPILDPIEDKVIAFFPQAQAWNSNNPHLIHGFHDVPVNAPELVAELSLPEWPYRQLPARLYHALFPPRRAPEARDLSTGTTKPSAAFREPELSRERRLTTRHNL